MKEKEQKQLYPNTVTIYRNGLFIEWKTQEKRPWVYNQNPSDFHKTLSAEWGPYSWAYVSAVMRLAQEYGTSLGPTIQPEHLVAGNTLGENDAELSLDEIFAKFTMTGLPEDLPVTYGTIQRTMTRETALRVRQEREELIARKMEDHKQRMAKFGFPFD